MADQGAEGLLSPFLRERRFRATKSFLQGNILDIGCGTGKLASLVSPDRYLGIEIDDFSRELAQKNFPEYRFQKYLPESFNEFDTVVALAVIEHIKDPVLFLVQLSRYLKDMPGAKIVCTTPHPLAEPIHEFGANIGLFSKHANEEHEHLLDKKRLESIAKKANLDLVIYHRFLLGANQLSIFQKQLKNIQGAYKLSKSTNYEAILQR